MAAKPGIPRAVPSLARGWVGKLGFHQAWQIALAVFLAATAAFGGLDTVDNKVTPVKAGEPFDDGEFNVTIERASAVDEIRAATLKEAAVPGQRYLGVVATLRNNGTIPASLEDEIDLRDHPDAEYVQTYRYADGSVITTLQPGLTEQLVYVWQLPQSQLQPGTLVTIRLWRKQFREFTTSYGRGWVDSITEYGEIELPVKVVQ
ncbi:MAG TPA: hypothetical protein VFB19_14680 [Mycobacterium sp.]|nr:hypothetical protein [Mycobacterium sp.]